MTKETTGTASVPGASPQKQALLEAFDSVLKQQAENREADLREEAARRRSRNRVRPTIWTAAVLALFLCTYLYIERPEWLFPASAPPESIAIQQASLRIGMANVAQHVERYRHRRGKLPSTLLEAGTQVEGITYQPLDSTEWRLIGSHGGVELTLASREPLPKFLGNSFEVISRRSR
ncbi:MAG TPA: hypothetical protein VM094_06140 [Gemmatimonadales bacterium]|nr:hypothetical protein [Gemmatimonadales bacterium]